jgi:hypothetical protein
LLCVRTCWIFLGGLGVTRRLCLVRFVPHEAFDGRRLDGGGQEGVVNPEATRRAELGRPFRALCVWWARPRALPWAALGSALGAGEPGVWGERACWERGAHAKTLRREGRLGRAGRRTPCAERAVILTAVQSLRLAWMEGASSENAELGLSAPRGGGGEAGSREGAKGFLGERGEDGMRRRLGVGGRMLIFG